MKALACVSAFFLSSSAISAESALTGQLREIVEINSGSANLEGVLRVQKWIETRLKEIGFSTEIQKSGLLVGKKKGQTEKTIAFIVHADTVFEKTSAFQKLKISDDGKIGYGPGVIDDKGGVIVALEGLKRFLKAGEPKYSLLFVVSPAEETGSSEVLEAFRGFAKDPNLVMAFGVEPALDNGSVVHTRKGNRWYKIQVKGKEAHAGRAHREGISACNALALALAELSKLTNYKNDVTASVGHMEGGKNKYNIVCGEASAKVDTRFPSLKLRDALHANIEKVLKREFVKGAVVSFEIDDDTPPFSVSRHSKPVIESYLSVVRKIENNPRIGSEKSGGTADTNVFSREDVVLMDGLGPIGGKMHTEEEFVVLSSLETRAEALARFLSALN